MRYTHIRAAIVLALAMIAMTATPALAWRHWGWGPGVYFGIFPPVVVGPPVYYGPPAYYGPPGYYAPPPRPAGDACYAGAYVCPLDRPGPAGAPCSCPTNSGRAGGYIG